MSRLRSVLLLLPLLVVLTGCGGGPTIVVVLQLGGADAFQGVSTVRLQATGPAPMQTIEAEIPRRSGAELQLESLPYGTGRRIVVEGLDAERFAVARGESTAFEVTRDGPERIDVPFAHCSQSLSRDQDGDGYGASGSTRLGCGQAGWVTSGGDCDDKDARAHPGQTEFFTTPRQGGGDRPWDFNCDGVEEQQRTADCAGATPCKGEGWASAMPACGQVGKLASCEKSGATCAPSSTQQDRQQACR